MSGDAVDVGHELGRSDLPEHLRALGFDPEDAAGVLDAARRVLARPEELAVVEEAAGRLTARLGVLPASEGQEVWEGLALDDDGVLPLLALLATAPALARLHASRDVPDDVSAATLADLAQQVRVHRRVHGTFGLGTYAWVGGHVWSGALYRLGRLQYDLTEVATVEGSRREWVLSVHIPATGRLAPADVDASLAAAPPFFAERFPEAPAQDLHCLSWMLDPRLPSLLPGSNLASFQRRWRTYGEPQDGDVDALFFAFGRRGSTDLADLAALPAETTLQRAVRSLWRAGEHWHVVEGRLVRPPAEEGPS